jgi:hypothetical protein
MNSPTGQVLPVLGEGETSMARPLRLVAVGTALSLVADPLTA